MNKTTEKYLTKKKSNRIFRFRSDNDLQISTVDILIYTKWKEKKNAANNVLVGWARVIKHLLKFEIDTILTILAHKYSIFIDVLMKLF